MFNPEKALVQPLAVDTLLQHFTHLCYGIASRATKGQIRHLLPRHLNRRIEYILITFT
jgi:hypothetical protein